VGFLKRFRQDASWRNFPELALVGELIGLPNLRQHSERFFPHGTGVARINPEASLFIGVGAASTHFDSPVGQLIHHGDTFGDAYGMMVRQNRHAKADPNALGSLA
jgi:hypothetical protein